MNTPAKASRIFRAAEAGVASYGVVEAMEPRRMMTVTYTLNDVAEFGNSVGYESVAGVIRDASGNLYGTTKLGGANNLGAVYKVANGSNTVQTIASFSAATGCYPTSDLVMDTSGNLYGTTPYDAGNSQGGVFEVHAGSSTVTLLASFTSSANNIGSVKLAVDSSGNLYGVTPLGGLNGEGSIYKVVAGSGTITTLASFSVVTGDYPSSGLVMDGSGNLYGTTPRGGADGFGSIYEFVASNSSIKVLTPFTSVNGPQQASSLIFDTHGNLFGTTEFGGANSDGTVYELPSGGSSITTLATFNGSNGANPSAAMTIDASGDLFGTTAVGGPSSDGTAFEVAVGSNTITTLASFNGTNGLPGTDGATDNPIMPGILSDGQGDFFGVAPGGTSSNVGAVYEITPQLASQIVITHQPASPEVAGSSQTMALSMETPSGTVDTTNHAAVTLAITSGPPGAVLSGTLTSSAVSGLVNFSGLSFKTAGTYIVTASSAGVTSASTTSIIVGPAMASALVVTQQPTNAAAGQPIGTTLVAVEDAYGNISTTNASTMNISAGTGVTLNGAGPRQASAGVATFSGISINNPGTYQFQISDPGFPSVNTSSFVIGAGAATHLIFTQQPLPSVVAGQSLGNVTVDVEDAYGNICTGDSSIVSLATPNNTPLIGTSSEAASGGVATFPGISIDIAGTYKLTASDTGLAWVNSSSFVVTPAAASKLIVTQQPQASTMAGQSIGPATVAVEDVFGNIITGNTSTMKAAVTDGTPLAGTGSMAATSGVATFNGLSITKAGTYTLTITDPGLISANTSSFVITAAPAAKLIITQQPSSAVVAGQPISAVIVAVEDVYGNIVTTDSSAVSAATNDGTPLGGTIPVSANGGVATFSDLSITKVGTYTLTLTDGSLTPATTTSITVIAAAASQLVVTEQPTLATAGLELGWVMVQVEDPFGNLCITDHSNVTVSAAATGSANTSAEMDGTLTFTAQGGVATYGNLSISTAGVYTLTATDAALTPATTTPITVTQPPHVSIAGNNLARISLDTNTAFQQNAGNLTVTLQSNAENNATVLTRTVRAQKGLVQVSNIRMLKAGNYTMLISNAKGDSVTEQFTVIPNRAVKLAFSVLPTSTSGLASVTVNATDAYGNITSAVDGRVVKLSLGRDVLLGKKPVVGGTLTATLANGTATFPAVSITGTSRLRLQATAAHLAGVLSGVFENS